MGATLPGCPLMAVGRTPRLAWGVTYLHADTSDYFVEDCRPGGETGWQYRRGERWFDFQDREEEIRRKGASAEVMHVYENSQGTMRLDLTDREPGKYLSTRWIGSEEGGGPFGGLLAQCDSKRQYVGSNGNGARESSSDVGVGLRRPRRSHRSTSQRLVAATGCRGEWLLPTPAWEIVYHWQGKQSSESLPSLYRSTRGVPLQRQRESRPGRRAIDPQPRACPTIASGVLPSGCTSCPQPRSRTCKQLQYDVTSLHARLLLPILLPHVPDGPLRDLLVAWDCATRPRVPLRPCSSIFIDTCCWRSLATRRALAGVGCST